MLWVILEVLMMHLLFDLPVSMKIMLTFCLMGIGFGQTVHTHWSHGALPLSRNLIMSG